MPQNNELKLIISAEVEKYLAALNKAESQTNSFGSKAKSALMGIGTSLATGFGIYELVNQLKGAYLAAEEVSRVNARLEAVLKATGYAAGLTASNIDDMASKFMDLTGIDDEVIKGAQTVLLTFRNIGSDIFPEATQAMLDMSAVMGQDLQSSAVQLGKALNDPIEGVSALRRVGVQLTQQQEDQIKTLVKNNQGMEAQKIILEELKKEFGGAAAASKTFSQEITTAFGNLQESFGSLMQSENAITTYLRNLAGGWQVIIDKIRIASTEINNLSFDDAQTKLQDVEIKKYQIENDKMRQFLSGGKEGIKSTAEYKNLENEETALNKRIQLLYKQKQAQEELAKKAANEEAKNKNRFNTGGGSKKTEDKTENAYKSILDSINNESNAINTKNKLRQQAAKSGINTENEYYKAVESLALEKAAKLRDIETSDAANKGELKIKLNQLYTEKASQLEIDLALKKNKEIYEAEQKAGEERLQVIQEAQQRYQESYNKKIDLIKQYENERIVVENSDQVEKYLLEQGYNKGASYFSDLKKLYEDFRIEEKRINDESILDEQQKNEAKLALNEAYKAKTKQLFINANDKETEKEAEKFKQIWGNAYEDLFSQQRNFVDISKKLMLDLTLYYMQLTLKRLALSESATLKEIALDSNSAIIKAIKSVVETPFVGPALAIGAAAGTAALIANFARRENGGPVIAGVPYIVGEKRAEVFVPNQNGYIRPNTDGLHGGGAGGQQQQGTVAIINNYNIKAWDSQDVKQYLYAHAKDIANIQNSNIRDNVNGARTTIRSI